MFIGYQTILKINVLIGEFFLKKKRSQNITTIVYILMYFSY